VECSPKLFGEILPSNYLRWPYSIVFSCVVFVPVDVIKNKMQLQRSVKNVKIPYPGQVFYDNTFDAWRKIVKVEGLYGLYKGYGATLLSFGPFSGLYFLFYEEASDELDPTHSEESISNSRNQIISSSSLKIFVFTWCISEYISKLLCSMPSHSRNKLNLCQLST